MQFYSSTSARGFRLPKFLYASDAEHVLDVAAAMPCNGRYAAAFNARYAALATLYYTAIRRAECIGLGVEDLHFGEGIIRILGKGDKERLVPMHPDLEVILRAYLADRITPQVTIPSQHVNRSCKSCYDYSTMGGTKKNAKHPAPSYEEGKLRDPDIERLQDPHYKPADLLGLIRKAAKVKPPKGPADKRSG